MSNTFTFAKMHNDGTLVRINADGSKELLPRTTPAPMTNEEIEAAALGDPDAQPLTDDALKRLRPVARIKTLRRAIGVTQEEFAARYHIPLGTLRDWEQGRVQPDQPARAYLTVIACDPDGVQRALDSGPSLTP